ncbi:hypothetical protein I4F81_001541 [Pyropia yezoensis]|uniref:Uncharacterized protein n=1 Tax=Pyropia yezoensis TaxID=2788 RepID=A0ACC3BN81_PYRYE|nr:hypothetical protein I4F81_001541 [Neopyropia yezoensis]
MAAPAYALGDRAALAQQRPFPIDTTAWPSGYGQLTPRGLAQSVAFGRSLRRRYVDPPGGTPTPPLLSSTYHHAETHVRATDVDRTLSSAAGIMMGLYGAAAGGAVPVHTVEYARDALLDGSARSHCPAFAAAADAVYDSELVAGAIGRSTGLLAALPALTGTPPREVDAMTTLQLAGLITGLRDLRVCQRAHGVAVPSAVSRWDRALEDVTARVTIAKWDVPGLGGLVGGRLLRATARRVRVGVGAAAGAAWATARSGLGGECNALGHDADESGECPRRLTLYVAHDTTVFDVRAALGLPVAVERGAYVSHVILELRTAAAGNDTALPAKAATTTTSSASSLDAYTVTVLTGVNESTTAPEGGPYCGGAATCSAAAFVDWVDAHVPANVATACGLSASAAAGEPGAASAAAADGATADAAGEQGGGGTRNEPAIDPPAAGAAAGGGGGLGGGTVGWWGAAAVATALAAFGGGVERGGAGGAEGGDGDRAPGLWPFHRSTFGRLAGDRGGGGCGGAGWRRRGL